MSLSLYLYLFYLICNLQQQYTLLVLDALFIAFGLLK